MAEPLDQLANAALAQSLTGPGASVRRPKCCGVDMIDDGGCSEGCCDDYHCGVCGKTLRIEWPD